MVADGTYTAVLDRFEDEQGGDSVAVFLLEGDDGVVAEKLLDERRLPEDARRPDAVCELRVEDDDVVDVEYDAEETDRRASSAQSRFDRLARRPDDDSSDVASSDVASAGENDPESVDTDETSDSTETDESNDRDESNETADSN